MDFFRDRDDKNRVYVSCKYFVGPACEKAWIYERVPGFEFPAHSHWHLMVEKECVLTRGPREVITLAKFTIKTNAIFQ